MGVDEPVGRDVSANRVYDDLKAELSSRPLTFKLFWAVM
jgi:hypothetical protein